MEIDTGGLIKPSRITCNTCGGNIAVNDEGFLVNHKKSRGRGGPRCDGSGRHFSFVLYGKEQSSN